MWKWGDALPNSSSFSTKLFSLWKLSESIIYFSLKIIRSSAVFLGIAELGPGPLAIWAPESAATLCVGALGVASSFPEPHRAKAVVCNRRSPRAYEKGPLAQNGAKLKQRQTSSPACSPPWLSVSSSLVDCHFPGTTFPGHFPPELLKSPNFHYIFFIYINVFIFNCRILALQCCVGFCHT